MYLTHIEPINPRNGKETMFIFRDNHKSHLVIKSIDHLINSRRMHNDLAFPLFIDLETKYPHIKFLLTSSSSQSSFISALCNREDKQQLSLEQDNNPIFLTNPWHNSPSKILKIFYPLGMKINSLDDIPDLPTQRERTMYNDLEFITLDELSNETCSILDIEVTNWMRGSPEIFNVIYHFQNEKYLFHTLPFELEQYADVNLVPCTDEEDLGLKLTQKILDDDPLFMVGHNIMAYDFLRLRELKSNFKIGLNNSRPLIKSFQGFKKILIKGRYILDTYPYSQNYSNIHYSNTLESLIKFHKTISYLEQDKLYSEAKSGSFKAFLKLIEYVIGDGNQSNKSKDLFLNKALEKSILFKKNLGDICSTSSLELSKSYWEMKFFREHLYDLNDWKNYYKCEENLSISKYLFNKIKSNNISWSKGKYVDIKLIQFVPIVKLFYPILPPKLKAKYDRIGEFNVDDSFDILKTIDSLVSYPFEELISLYHFFGLSFGEELLTSELLVDKLKQNFNNLPNKKRKRYSSADEFINHFCYGEHKYLKFYFDDINRVSYLTSGSFFNGRTISINNELVKMMDDIFNITDSNGLINFSSNFYLLSSKLSNQLNEIPHHDYGSFNLVSLARNSFILSNSKSRESFDGIYQGFSIGKRSNFEYEKELINKLIQLYFNDENPLTILNHYEDAKTRLLNQEVDKTKLLIKISRDEGNLHLTEYFGKSLTGLISLAEFMDPNCVYDSQHYINHIEKKFKNFINVLTSNTYQDNTSDDTSELYLF